MGSEGRGDVAKVASCIQQLAVYAAWHAANSRSFLWSAERDLEKAEALARELEELLPKEAQAIKALVFRSGWLAANRRSFFSQGDALEDQRAVDFYVDLLKTLTKSKSPQFAEHLRSLALNASWHAANTRSMLWRDAQKDASRFERDCSALAPLLRALCFSDSGSEGSEGSEGFRTPRETEAEASEAKPAKPAKPERALVPSAVLQRCSLLDETVSAWQSVRVVEAIDARDGGRHNGGVHASSFLFAASVTVLVFDAFGLKVLHGFQADMRKNIDMVQQHVRGDVSLEQLVDSEAKAAGSHAKALREGSASMGLLWLSRSLRLLQTMLAKLTETNGGTVLSLGRCIQAGYETSLRPHHNFVTRQVISAALRALPLQRAEFLAKLGGEGGVGAVGGASEVLAKVSLLLEAFVPPLHQVCAHLRSAGLEAA